MKTNTKDKIKDSWAIPGDEISEKEFIESIKKAEKGPFYTIEESKKMIEEWRKQRNSK